MEARVDTPSYISARSANSLISESRPTRIQTESLLVLNHFLDELLLLILTSAKSLATDRIKSDGMLRVLNNNMLSKNAVLEAELELRSYVEAKRAEGAKVPLGLMATSRLDGTEHFPVTSAYNALRIRCQYYSTLGDREDESASTDQNIMSSDGRPIATITQGVAIYVTALLEFVGEHILKSVAAVVERDNSDEASIHDLRAAIEEDDQLAFLYSQMSIKRDIHRRTANGEINRTVRSETRTAKPWQVPTENDYNEAAGPPLFPTSRPSKAPSESFMLRAAAASLGHGTKFGRESITSITTSTSHGLSVASSASRITSESSVPSDAGSSLANTRRQSSDRSWSGVFGGSKRRLSLRLNSDSSNSLAKTLSPSDGLMPKSAALAPTDDFEALMMSGQTMKVSLTSNRLRTIEVAKDTQTKSAAGAARKRPGTATINPVARDESLSPVSLRHSMSQERSPASSAFEGRIPSRVGTPVPGDLSRRTSSRISLPLTRPERKAAPPPPSAYRSVSPALLGTSAFYSSNEPEPQLQPRVSDSGRMPSQELTDLYQPSTPRSAVSESFSAPMFRSSSDMDVRRKAGVGDRVRNLFVKKSGSGPVTPTSPFYPLLAQSNGEHDEWTMSAPLPNLPPSAPLLTASEPLLPPVPPKPVTIDAEPPAPSSVKHAHDTPGNDTVLTTDKANGSMSRQTHSIREEPEALTDFAKQQQQMQEKARVAMDDAPSRKVQWGYKRASSNFGHNVDRNSTTSSDRRRSGGNHSSSAHGHAFTNHANAPSPVPQEDTTRCQRCESTELIQVLTDLERSMRNCVSVSECLALLKKAMHAPLEAVDLPTPSLSASALTVATIEQDTLITDEKKVVAWLLDGGEISMQHTVSLDSEARRYSSGVTSIQSNYKDAMEEHCPK